MSRLHSSFLKPTDPHVLRLTVSRTERVSPNFMRVTLTGDDLAKFTRMGWDQWFRLFLPQEPTLQPRLPTSASARWWPQVLRMPADERPHVRNYTVSDYRPEQGELDVDFVMHGAGDHDSDAASSDAASSDAGVAAAWAASAEAGWPVGLLDQGIGWSPPAQPQHILVVGDETALPAVAGIARDLAADVRGTMIVEVPHPDDRRDLGQPDGVDVRWIVRDGDSGDDTAKPGQQALAAAASVDFAGEPDAMYAYVSGEQALATGLRRALVARGVPKSHITFCGYWRL